MTGEALGLGVHIQYGTYWAAGRIGKEPYGAEVTDYDQVMLWMGADTNDMGELGAEVELSMGEEMERHIITTPTITIQPNGFPHCPLVVTKLDKPFIFAVIRPFYSMGGAPARTP